MEINKQLTCVCTRDRVKKFAQFLHNFIDVELRIFGHGFNDDKKYKKYYNNTKNDIVYKLHLFFASVHILISFYNTSLSIFKNISFST